MGELSDGELRGVLLAEDVLRREGEKSQVPWRRRWAWRKRSRARCILRFEWWTPENYRGSQYVVPHKEGDNTDCVNTIRLLYPYFTAGDLVRDGVLEMASEDRERGLKEVVAHKDIAYMLSEIIAREKGNKHETTLRDLIEAGLAIAEFEELDPALSVARPGIEARYNRLAELKGEGKLKRKQTSTVEVIRRTTSHGLGEHKASFARQ